MLFIQFIKFQRSLVGYEVCGMRSQLTSDVWGLRSGI